MQYDYVVMQPTNRTCTTKEALTEQIQSVKDAFSAKSPGAKYYVLIPATYYLNDTAVNREFRQCFASVEEEMNVKILLWGKLIADIVNGVATVENSTETYNKNSFIVSASASDGYHPNQLTGYITTQYVFSTITDKKAEGEDYAFCTDTTLHSSFDMATFLQKHYVYDNVSTAGNLKGDALTNYPEILNSPTEMLGLQKLIDIYRKAELPKEDVDEEKEKKSAIFLGNSLTYLGMTVFDGGQNVDSTSLSKRFGDTGYFYQLAQQNNIDMEVTNWTWGGHSLSHMLGTSCTANRGHNGNNHLAALKNNSDMKFDYVIYQPTNSFTSTEESLRTDIALLKSVFGTANPDAEYILLIPTTYYTNTTDAIKNFRKCFPTVEDDLDVTFVLWGDLVVDLINGDAEVDNSAVTYNKYSFMVSSSASDGYNPNQLAGYITAQYLFSAISGQKAEGESYAFCTDASLHDSFSLSEYLTNYYKYDYDTSDGTQTGDAITNYPEILKSSTEMTGLQKLIDRHIKEKPYRTVQ